RKLFALPCFRSRPSQQHGLNAMANPDDHFWNAERMKQLKQLHAEGLSFSLIAAKLGRGLSRDSVASKLNRIGLRRSKPVTAKQKPAPPAPLPPRKRIMKHVQAPSPVNGATTPLVEGRTFMELRDGDCRWSFGYPGDSVFFFCVAPAVDGFPYCRDHCARAYHRPSRKPATGNA